CWMGCREPSSPASPSTVMMSAPLACTASIKQERIGSPLYNTVQQPQTPCSQPTCVPVNPSSWRKKSLKSRRGSASPETALPFTVKCSVLVCDAEVCSSLIPGSFGARAPRQCSAPGASTLLPPACDTLAKREYPPSAPATPWPL